MEKPVLVIMAAGMGSRYGGLKQLDPVDEYGHIIMDFSIYDAVAAGFEGRPVLVALRQDMAKALGHALALRLPSDKPILCIDSIHLTADSYLDVGAPIGPALPVVVKTLILSN